MHATKPLISLRLACLSALVGTLALVACGGSDDATAPAPPPAANTLVPASITLLAGGGQAIGGDCGSADGAGADARLGRVADMVVAPDGTVHLLEGTCDNYAPTRVRSISKAGVVTTPAVASSLAPMAGGPLVSFRRAMSLAVGDNGDVYLGDGDIQYSLGGGYPLTGPATGIWKITPTGAVPFAGLRTWSATDPADGVGLQAQFTNVRKVAWGQGALYVLDTPDTRRVTADGTVTTVPSPQWPLVADNAGTLYQLGAGAWRRLDGSRTIPVPETGDAGSVFTLSSDGAVYFTERGRIRMWMEIYRRSVDGGFAKVADQLAGQSPTWNHSPSVDPQKLGLDRAGNLYVLHGHKLWRATFK